jgi:hypothetical protein
MGQAVMVKSSEVRLDCSLELLLNPCVHSVHSLKLSFPNLCFTLSLLFQAEKNLAWEAAQQSNAAMQQMNALAASMGPSGSGPCKLSVSNLHPNIQVGNGPSLFVCQSCRRLPFIGT